jgi:hypothetical protein
LAAVDKHLRYMLVILDNKMTLIINLRSEKVSDILHYDFSNILGMFFITNQSGSNQVQEELKFCLVLSTKIVYFKICCFPNESIQEVKTVKINQTSNYLYNSRFMILAIEKSEKHFELFNLSNEKFYSKTHAFHLQNKTIPKPNSSLTKFFGIFNKKNPKQESEKIDLVKESIYKKTQYYLETIYKKLYFICLNYEDAEIQIYEIESLVLIKKVKGISFDSSQICTLQFVDNLILLHNFERCDTILIDLKAENPDKIICKY